MFHTCITQQVASRTKNMLRMTSRTMKQPNLHHEQPTILHWNIINATTDLATCNINNLAAINQCNLQSTCLQPCPQPASNDRGHIKCNTHVKRLPWSWPYYKTNNITSHTGNKFQTLQTCSRHNHFNAETCIKTYHQPCHGLESATNNKRQGTTCNKQA